MLYDFENERILLMVDVLGNTGSAFGSSRRVFSDFDDKVFSTLKGVDLGIGLHFMMYDV